MALGPIMANCYVLGCEATRAAAVIDPGEEAPRILDALKEDGLTLKYILNTHGHFDHVGANRELKQAVPEAQLMIHGDDAPMLGQLANSARMFGMQAENSPEPDKLLQDKDLISFGDIDLEVFHVPGHSPGGVAFISPEGIFVGDTLFAGSIGRTDLPGGNFETLIASIQNRLFELDDATPVYPGHMGPTTIGQEKRFNPFCAIR
jgi:glyoxylase-like metal-dependent hydrolase (beta-lactamase superfamily II)